MWSQINLRLLIRGPGGRQIHFKDLAFEGWKNILRKLKLNFRKSIAIEVALIEKWQKYFLSNVKKHLHFTLIKVNYTLCESKISSELS